MRIENQLKTVLRFYESLDLQAVNNSDCDDVAYNEFIICDDTTLLPFQVRRPYDAGAIVHTLKVVCIDTLVETEIIAACLADCWIKDLQVTVEDEYWDYITYQPQEGCDLQLNAGVYYATYSDGTSTWYSEYFRVFNFDGSENDFRIYSRNLERRLSDVTDYRIHKL